MQVRGIDILAEKESSGRDRMKSRGSSWNRRDRKLRRPVIAERRAPTCTSSPPLRVFQQIFLMKRPQVGRPRLADSLALSPKPISKLFPSNRFARRSVLPRSTGRVSSSRHPRTEVEFNRSRYRISQEVCRATRARTDVRHTRGRVVFLSPSITTSTLVVYSIVYPMEVERAREHNSSRKR